MFTDLVRAVALAAPLATTFLGAVTLNANAANAASLHTPGINRRSNQHARLASAHEARRSTGKKLRRRGDGKSCKIRSTGQITVVENAVSTAASSAWVEPSSTQAADAWSSTAEAPSAAPTSTWEAQQSTESAAPSSTSSEAAVVTSTPGSGTNDKSFGLAWPNGDWESEGQPGYVGQYVGDRTGWYYTWSPQGCSKADALGLEFAPMMWGRKDANADWWNAVNSWGDNVQAVLFFNEPNEISQSNISPDDAVPIWKEYMAPLKEKGYKLGMAAPTNAPSGLEWVKRFVELCPECEYDFQPLHWYDVKAVGFQQYVESFYQATGKPIWVTEYACQSFNYGTPQCTEGETWGLHQEMAKWFDAQPYVERYSPFGAMRQMQGVNDANRLMDASGYITALGDWYVKNA
ncbi:hypothetical protein NCC49_001382 [Naganishia albida]|nr:hypothetical protein NCC49_001382 [Naganishia albida]